MPCSRYYSAWSQPYSYQLNVLPNKLPTQRFLLLNRLETTDNNKHNSYIRFRSLWTCFWNDLAPLTMLPHWFVHTRLLVFTSRLALSALLASLINIHHLCGSASRRNSRLGHHTRWLHFAHLLKFFPSFRGRGLGLVWFPEICSISLFLLLPTHLIIVTEHLHSICNYIFLFSTFLCL